MTTLQAPIDLSSATRVGPRVYRKQVLAKRTIDYPLPDGTVQTVTFDDEYLRDLATAYNDGAYDLVPFQLATGRNEHNEDPRNYGGRVLGAEVTDDGLDLILELSEEAADLVEKTGGRLGVSARIKPVRHVDGRTFKRAIRHVLGTLDPRMQNLRPWQPVVDLAADDDGPVLDLSGYTYQQEGSTMPRIIDLSALADEDAEALASFAAASGIDLSAAEVDDEPDLEPDEPAGDDEPAEETGDDAADEDDQADEDDEQDDAGEGITDDELEALIDAELEASGVSLSTPADFADPLDLSDPLDADPLDLAAGLVAVTGDERQTRQPDEAAALRAQLAQQEWSRKGVPPHLIDLATPILALSDDDADAIDLATPDGNAIDVRGVVRDMLDAVAGTIDLSSEAGYGHETEPEQQVSNLASAWTEYLENN